MTAPVTDFTSYAEIRAVLGVNGDEIDDDTLGLGVWVMSLVAELDDVSEELADDYATVAAIGEADRSSAQQKFYAAVRLFAPYCVGNQLASALPLFSPKSVTDGKAGFSRYADSPYKRSIDECRASYSRFLLRLTARYAIFKNTTSQSVVRTFLYAASPTLDPVAG